MQMRLYRSVKSNLMKNETDLNILCFPNSKMKMERTVNVRSYSYDTQKYVILLATAHIHSTDDHFTCIPKLSVSVCAHRFFAHTLIHRFRLLHPISHDSVQTYSIFRFFFAYSSYLKLHSL